MSVASIERTIDRISAYIYSFSVWQILVLDIIFIVFGDFDTPTSAFCALTLMMNIWIFYLFEHVEQQQKACWTQSRMAFMRNRRTANEVLNAPVEVDVYTNTHSKDFSFDEML